MRACIGYLEILATRELYTAMKENVSEDAEPELEAASSGRFEAAERSLARALAAVRDIVAAAALFVLPIFPWLPSHGALVSLVLAVFAAALVWVPCQSIAWGVRAAVEGASSRTLTNTAGVVVGALCAIVVILGGVVLSNLAFVDGPRDPLTIAGYGVFLVLGLLVGRFAHVKARQRARGDGGGTLAALCAVAAGASVCLTLADVSGFPSAVFLPSSIVLLGLPLAVLAVQLAPWRWRARALVALACLACSVALLGASGRRASWDRGLAEMAVSYTPARRLLTVARDATDRDGDGYSAWLGGGDCDDTDPAAFPLSMTGPDCSGLLGAASPASAPNETAVAPAVRANAPEIVLVVTVDALRCHHGQGDPEPLKGACDAIEAFDRGAREQIVYTHHPNTRGSISSLFRGDPHASRDTRGRSSDASMAHDFRAAGYATRAVVTHPFLLADPAVRGGFESIDESLVASARSPLGVTSSAVTDLALAHIARAKAARERLFLWVHYFDPHAPYVRDASSRIVVSRPVSYATEVRRTTREIARLLESVVVDADAGRAVALVTADHGEEFGEHGSTHHGHTLYEAGVRVPLVILRGARHDQRASAASRPRALSQVRRFVHGLVHEGEPERFDDGVFLEAEGGIDAPIGWVEGRMKLIYRRSQNVWELYDLARDPEETTNLAYDRPRDVRRLAARLARALASAPPTPR